MHRKSTYRRSTPRGRRRRRRARRLGRSQWQERGRRRPSLARAEWAQTPSHRWRPTATPLPAFRASRARAAVVAPAMARLGQRSQLRAPAGPAMPCPGPRVQARMGPTMPCPDPRVQARMGPAMPCPGPRVQAPVGPTMPRPRSLPGWRRSRARAVVVPAMLAGPVARRGRRPRCCEGRLPMPPPRTTAGARTLRHAAEVNAHPHARVSSVLGVMAAR